MNNPARAPAPSQARTSGSVRASTPVRTSIPVRTSTPVRASTPVRTSTPVRAATPVQIPTPVRTPTPVQTPTPVRTPTPLRASTPVQTPTPLRTSTPVRTPTPVWTRTLVRIRTPVWTATPTPSSVPASESFSNSALCLDPPPEPAPEPTLSPDKDPAPTPPPSVKHVPPVASGFGPTQEPLPALPPSATDLPGPTLGATPRADPSTTKATDPLPGPIASIVGTLPSATQISTNIFASTSENFQVDSKITIRVIYCYGLRYILLKKSLDQQFPNRLLFEEDISTQASGEFEVFVEGKLVHSKKKGDGFVDEARLQKIVSIINEEIRKR